MDNQSYNQRSIKHDRIDNLNKRTNEDSKTNEDNHTQTRSSEKCDLKLVAKIRSLLLRKLGVNVV